MPGHEVANGGGGPLHKTAAMVGIRQWLKWRFNRLRCMAPVEIPHRILRALSAYAQSTGWFSPASAVPSPDFSTRPKFWVHHTARVDPAPYIAAADRIAAGRLDVFALRDIELGSPPLLNRDPKSGIEAPRSFGKLLDYRNPELVGDIKYLWEPNRHLHLVTLAQAYVLNHDPAYLQV